MIPGRTLFGTLGGRNTVFGPLIPGRNVFGTLGGRNTVFGCPGRGVITFGRTVVFGGTIGRLGPGRTFGFSMLPPGTTFGRGVMTFGRTLGTGDGRA